MKEAATRQHAHANTVYHCLYAYVLQAWHSKKHLAHIFIKSERTIRNWVNVYHNTGTFLRANPASKSQFTNAQRHWLFDYSHEHPLAFLDEAQDAFKKAQSVDISETSVWRIIHEFGLTWKVLERRAMHIKERDILRFVEELSHIDWCHQNLVFLDEVSFDNRGMIRKRGYSLRGKKVAIRGGFERKPRVSILAFIGVNEILSTEGAFDRLEFTKCCQDFVHCPGGPAHRFHLLPSNRVHCSNFLTRILPLFNPIEFLFGYVKRSFQRHYLETSGRDLMPFVIQTFRRYQRFNMSKVFEHCGWKIQGCFDPVGPFSIERSKQPEVNAEDSNQDQLGFTEIEEA